MFFFLRFGIIIDNFTKLVVIINGPAEESIFFVLDVFWFFFIFVWENYFSGVPAKTEKEQAMFREQIEQLRQDAGENWLSYYNDMVVKVMFFNVCVLRTED